MKIIHRYAINGKSMQLAKGIDLGCGMRIASKDILRVDINPSVQPDILHNLNIFPYPFGDNEFEIIYCIDTLDHLDDIVMVMEEIHRIAKVNAVVHITVPHFSSANAYADVTHKHFFSLFSFDYFTGQNKWNFYTKVRFRKKRSQLVFYPSPFYGLIMRLANRYPGFYERRLCWIFPAWFIRTELQVIK